MAVVLRLQRIGKPHQAHYRLVAIEKSRGPHGRALEVLGSYDPRGEKTKEKVKLKDDRVEYWMKNGAKASPTAESLIKQARKAAKGAATAKA
jgi:small subunit ribosomal protein S16